MYKCSLSFNDVLWAVELYNLTISVSYSIALLLRFSVVIFVHVDVHLNVIVQVSHSVVISVFVGHNFWALNCASTVVFIIIDFFSW